MSIDSIKEISTGSPIATGGVRRRWRVSGGEAGAGIAAVLQRRADAPAGLLQDALADHGLRVVTVRADLGEPLPDPASVRLAVALGADEAAEELARVDRRTARLASRSRPRRHPVLGIGSGAHALGVALGGGSEPAARSQHGWIHVSSAVPRWIAPGPWLAWREDVVRPPRAARVLASGAVGPEAFTVNGHLGVQFHPEVTPEIVREWVTRPDRVLDSQGILEATWRDHADALRATRRLAAGFLRSLDIVAPRSLAAG